MALPVSVVVVVVVAAVVVWVVDEDAEEEEEDSLAAAWSDRCVAGAEAAFGCCSDELGRDEVELEAESDRTGANETNGRERWSGRESQSRGDETAARRIHAWAQLFSGNTKTQGKKATHPTFSTMSG